MHIHLESVWWETFDLRSILSCELSSDQCENCVVENLTIRKHESRTQWTQGFECSFLRRQSSRNSCLSLDFSFEKCQHSSSRMVMRPSAQKIPDENDTIIWQLCPGWNEVRKRTELIMLYFLCSCSFWQMFPAPKLQTNMSGKSLWLVHVANQPIKANHRRQQIMQTRRY